MFAEYIYHKMEGKLLNSTLYDWDKRLLHACYLLPIFRHEIDRNYKVPKTWAKKGSLGQRASTNYPASAGNFKNIWCADRRHLKNWKLTRQTTHMKVREIEENHDRITPATFFFFFFFFLLWQFIYFASRVVWFHIGVHFFIVIFMHVCRRLKTGMRIS